MVFQAVTSKIEDGNLKAAGRILCSEDKLADYSDDVYNQPCQKHPAPSGSVFCMWSFLDNGGYRVAAGVRLGVV